MKKIIFLFLFTSALCQLHAQVGINNASPDASSLLDVTATDKGILIPRVDIADLSTAAPVTTPATGLLAYNTNATTGIGFYFWDSTQWLHVGAGGVKIDNGLYENTGADRVRLGGSLVENTTITHETFNLTHNLSSTGDFHIADNGTNRFSVLDNGRTTVGGVNNAGQFNVTGNSYFSDDIHLRDGAVNGGDILVRIYDSSDDGIIDVYENNAYNIRLHGNGASVFNEQGIANNDFRIESVTQSSIFFIDASTNRVGIRTAAPTNMLHMTNGGENVGANLMAAFENFGAEGVAIGGTNQGATNSYNAIEGITNYIGGGFIPAGIFGLGIAQNAAVNSPVIGVRGASNEWQGTGVRGSRFNSGGPNTGWGGQFYDDLGYTGFFGTISDSKTKKDIQTINGALSIINKLNPVTYNFDLSKYPSMGLNEEMEYGFIAQEVREILPEITRVKTFDTQATVAAKPNEALVNNNEEFTVMDYTRLIPILTKAIQEQQAQIEALKTRIEQLENN